MTANLHETFLTFVRLEIGVSNDVKISESTDWVQLKALADMHGLSAIVLDGVEAIPNDIRPPKAFLLEWIGEVLQGEQTYKLHQEVASDMANLFYGNGIRTYVLKGRIIAECYPRQSHRVSSDMDCYLLSEIGHEDAWDKGNSLIEARGFGVGIGFYKNSTFHLPGLMVESHRFLTPFRGNKKLKALEKVLQALLVEDKGEDRFKGTWLYRPPVIVSALFLIEHAYSHFLHEGLTWRMVLDWVLFKKEHDADVDWPSFEAYIDEFEFRKFYNSFSRLGSFILGEVTEEDLTIRDKRMLVDIWAPLDLHETLHGVKGKLALVGNTWRARWKYFYFTEMSWVKALWIQVYGYLFDKHPTIS